MRTLNQLYEPYIIMSSRFLPRSENLCVKAYKAHTIFIIFLDRCCCGILAQLVGRYATGAIKLALNLCFQLMQMIVMFLKKKKHGMIIDDFKIRNFFNHYEDVKECLKKKT